MGALKSGMGWDVFALIDNGWREGTREVGGSMEEEAQ
jgi:hypothetical protein